MNILYNNDIIVVWYDIFYIILTKPFLLSLLVVPLSNTEAQRKDGLYHNVHVMIIIIIN
jgi:hypothetical protein